MRDYEKEGWIANTFVQPVSGEVKVVVTYVDGNIDGPYKAAAFCWEEQDEPENDIAYWKLHQELISTPNMNSGIKHDYGKLRYDLIPYNALDEVVKVLTFGSKKYSDGNWKQVENGQQRYEAAIGRHLSAHMQKELLDKESECYHMACVAADALFVLHFLLNKEE